MTASALPPDHAARLDRARLALEGLSVGDALGETCFLPENWNANDEVRHTDALGRLGRLPDIEMAKCACP
jgi:hypothetical protein